MMNPNVDGLDELDKIEKINISDKQTKEEDEAYEINKLKKDDAHVFKLPPMSSSRGHTTTDFQDENLIFRGKMLINQKGDNLIIAFINKDNTIFTAACLDENIDRHIVRATDSTRYFSLKVVMQDGPKWVGVVFKQRNDAFDFYHTIGEFKDKVAFEKKLEENKDKEYKPKYDFSLKTDQNKQQTSNAGQMDTSKLKQFKFGKKNNNTTTSNTDNSNTNTTTNTTSNTTSSTGQTNENK